jgi:hypothetical protein
MSSVWVPIEPVEPRMVSCFMKHPELRQNKKQNAASRSARIY